MQAVLWREWRGGPSVHCFLCAHHCRIAPGERGKCGVRENREGILYTLVYGCAISSAVDPIEKKPLFHFLPGSMSFSIATVGCNFTCSFCQNADISQMPRVQGTIIGGALTPQQVVDGALDAGCLSISYTYTEPTIFYEYARDCARLATASGLKNIFVTNGYMTAEMLGDIDGNLHAANVDLKSFSDAFYRSLVGARLKPVLDSIRRLWEMGVWVEVTTLLIPGRNDSEQELRALAAFLASISPDIPWHVSRFHPTYNLRDVPPTPVSAIEKALHIGREEGLHYIYGGNIPGHSSESTLCPGCGSVLIERQGFRTGESGITDGRCSRCGREVAIHEKGAPPWRS
ncbi:MAG: AmmeMemoRadiSam system radical SAM enzyme [Actinobacteria bacterium RBG_16_64_13]|nr:MAG: AmmeMemoRadiSam system radical SAM enzyme [Actinobacteria bacterium RBG_16_64_13]